MTFKHGLGGYRNHRCRCSECRQANTLYVAEQRAQNKRPKVLLEEEPWMQSAACRGVDVNLFHPQRGESANRTKQAKQICARCPYTEECLEYAHKFNITVGVWGGMSERQRRRDRARRRQEAAEAAA